MGIHAKQLLMSSFGYWISVAESPHNTAGFCLGIVGTALRGLKSLSV